MVPLKDNPYVTYEMNLHYFLKILYDQRTEAVAQRWPVKKLFVNILQNSKENNCVIEFLFWKREPYWKKLWHRCFPVNFAKFLRTLFYRAILVAASERILIITYDHRGLWSNFIFSLTPKLIIIKKLRYSKLSHRFIEDRKFFW